MFLYTYLKTFVLFFVVIIQYEDLITLPSCLNLYLKFSLLWIRIVSFREGLSSRYFKSYHSHIDYCDVPLPMDSLLFHLF